MSFANISLVGNLGADPETKYTPNGTMVVEMRIAVNTRQSVGQGQYEEKTTWYRISAWDRLADRLDRMAQQGYISKGGRLYVEGSFSPREYTTQDGRQGVSYDVRMNNFEFVGGRRDENQGQASSGGGYADNQGASEQADAGSDRRSTYNDDTESMDDVPF